VGFHSSSCSSKKCRLCGVGHLKPSVSTRPPQASRCQESGSAGVSGDRESMRHAKACQRTNEHPRAGARVFFSKGCWHRGANHQRQRLLVAAAAAEGTDDALCIWQFGGRRPGQMKGARTEHTVGILQVDIETKYRPRSGSVVMTQTRRRPLAAGPGHRGHGGVATQPTRTTHASYV
jgi:hypothetical protein